MSGCKHSHLTKANYFLILISFFFVSLLLYGPTLKAGFLSDDWTYLSAVKNQPLSSFFLNNIEGKREGGVYRPLVSLSFLLNYKTSGLTAWPYHLLNIFLHTLNGWLFFIFCFLIQHLVAGRKNEADEEPNEARRAKQGWLFPGLAAFFFLILPSQLETVAWLSARGDLLATTFFLLSLIFYSSFRSLLFSAIAENRRLGYFWWWLSLTAFFLALLSKEAAVTLPLVIILFEFLIFSRGAGRLTGWRRVSFIAPYFILLAVYLLLRLYATSILFGFYAAPNLNFNLGAWLDNFLGYGASLFFYGARRAAALDFLSAHYYYGWLIAASFFTLTIVWVKRRSLLLLAWSFFLLTILPVLSLSLERFDGAGERVLYLPSLGLALILALIFAEQSKIFLKLLGGALAIYFIFFTAQRALVWQDAGELAQNLLIDFAQTTELSKANTGVVILGLPDSLAGAYVWRNGFFDALSLVYPEYQPDVLLAQPKLKLSSQQSIIDWQKEGEEKFSARPRGSATGFFGPASLSSPDYQMQIVNYQLATHAGDRATWQFTPAFLAQLERKKIIFLTYSRGRLSKSSD